MNSQYGFGIFNNDSLLTDISSSDDEFLTCSSGLSEEDPVIHHPDCECPTYYFKKVDKSFHFHTW